MSFGIIVLITVYISKFYNQVALEVEVREKKEIEKEEKKINERLAIL